MLGQSQGKRKIKPMTDDAPRLCYGNVFGHDPRLAFHAEAFRLSGFMHAGRRAGSGVGPQEGSAVVVGPVPGHKVLQPVLKPGAGLKANGLLQSRDIGMGPMHVPGLHGHELYTGLSS